MQRPLRHGPGPAARAMSAMNRPTVAVVIPCYRVAGQVLSVLSAIGPECHRIYVVDDACPEQSGRLVQRECKDPRVQVLFHDANQGVGGAVITGYRRAMADGATVIVKIDGDGQMDPALLPLFVYPILHGMADYTKGNRFFDIEGVRVMPKVRLLGNAALSFLTKMSSGYWNLFDPTNGYTAIHVSAVRLLPMDKISPRYFFESDMLFRLNTLRAKVMDIPMAASYGSERSGLKVRQVFLEFLANNLRNLCKRIAYNYFLRDFSLATLQLVIGGGLASFGIVFGAYAWVVNAAQGTSAPTGTVMLAALPIILGIQLLLSFVGYDISNVPREAIHTLLQQPMSRNG